MPLIFRGSSVLSRGVVYMFVATLFFTLMHTLVKELKGVHLFQIIFFRSFVTWVLCLVFIQKSKVDLWGSDKKSLALRAALGVISMGLFFLTIQHMPLGIAVSIKYLSPLFTAIIGIYILKENVKLIQWLLFGAALFGVFLIKQFDGQLDTLYVILGLIGAFAGGGVYVVIRKVGVKEHPLTVIHYFMLLSSAVSGVLMLYTWQPIRPLQWFILLCVGIIGYVAQIYLTKAFQYEMANRVAPVKYMEVIYSVLISIVWFGEQYSIGGLVGIVIIITAMLINLLVKKKYRPDQ